MTRPAASQAVRFVCAITVICLVEMLVSNSALAATYTWGSAGTDWNTASNWGGTVPGSADVGLFNRSGYSFLPNVGETDVVGGIWDTGSGSLTIGGASNLALNGVLVNGNANTGIEMDAAAGPLTISAPTVPGNSQTWLNNSGSLLAISGNISNGNALTISGSGSTTISGGVANGYIDKTGAGTLTLGGNQDNAGLGLYVLQGTVVLAKVSGHAVSGGGGGMGGVSAGATLRLGASGTNNGQFYDGVNNMNGTFDLNGFSEGLIKLDGSGTVTNTALSTTSTLTFGYVGGGCAGGSDTFAGAIADGLGTMALSVSDTNGSFTLTGTNNAYSGGTSILAGQLNIGNGATSQGSLPGNVVISSTTAGALTFNTPAGMSITASGNISGSGSGGLTKIGAGILTLSGSNTCTGPIALNAGVIQAGNNSALGTSTAALAVNGGTLDVHGYSVNVGMLNGTGAIGNLSGSGSLTVGNGNASSTFAGTMRNPSGQLSLIKVGSGSFGLGGNVSLAGTATVSGGAINQSSGYVQPSTVIVDGGAYNLSGGSLSASTEYLGYFGAGSLAQSGGAHAVSSNLYLGYYGGSSGTYNLGSNGLLTASSEAIGYSGSGNFTQTGGTHAVSSCLMLGSNSNLALGSKSSGNYLLNGGSLSTGYEIIGEFGTGSFTQSGGTNSISGGMAIGCFAGGSGTYNFSGGSLSAPTEYVGYSGTGVFTQSGGTNAVSSLVLAQSPGSSGTYNLNGGLLLLPTSGLTKGSGTATFNFGGGTLGAGDSSSSPANTTVNETPGAGDLCSSSLNMNMSGIGGAIDTTGGNIGLSGNLSGAGGLTKIGSGLLILSGSNTYDGGTDVEAGTLYVTNSNVLPHGTSLTVSAEGTLIFDPLAGGASMTDGRTFTTSPARAVAAVPEPGTLALLGVTGIIAVAAAWRRRRN